MLILFNVLRIKLETTKARFIVSCLLFFLLGTGIAWACFYGIAQWRTTQMGPTYPRTAPIWLCEAQHLISGACGILREKYTHLTRRIPTLFVVDCAVQGQLDRAGQPCKDGSIIGQKPQGDGAGHVNFAARVMFHILAGRNDGHILQHRCAMFPAPATKKLLITLTSTLLPACTAFASSTAPLARIKTTRIPEPVYTQARAPAKGGRGP